MAGGWQPSATWYTPFACSLTELDPLSADLVNVFSLATLLRQELSPDELSSRSSPLISPTAESKLIGLAQSPLLNLRLLRYVLALLFT